jgi:GMP synthase (glutamine-hydrolysing)
MTGWDVRDFIKATINSLQQTVNQEKAILAVSGGVDSTTLALLAHRALENLLCIHIDHGLMRKHESETIVKNLKSLGLHVIFVDASEKFIAQLKNVKSSDEKRRIIGKQFIKEFESIAEKHIVKWFIQGTIAPDIIESTRGQAKRKTDHGHGGLIKIHHNVAGLPKEMKLNLIEPLKNLFKYQVRILAKSIKAPPSIESIKAPPSIADRQPFPGPGLACRITDEITHSKIDIIRNIDQYVENELNKYGSSQFFSILMNNQITSRSLETEKIISKYVKSNVKAYLLQDECIGVKGDERTLGKMVILDSDQKLEEFYKKISWLKLLKLQNEITGSVKTICRVSILITSPFITNQDYGITIRAIDTQDFMTAVPSRIDPYHLKRIGDSILNDYDSVKFVAYEITTKPAATIELI